MDEDGDLALARLAPEGATILAQAKIFDTTSWTTPTLAGTTLFARDREKIVALQLGQPGTPAARSRGAARPRGAAGSIDRAGTATGAKPAPTALAGTWRLNRERSHISDTAGLAGLIGAGVPPMLHITQPANGTILVESPINEGHVRMYTPGGKTAFCQSTNLLAYSPSL